MKKATFLLLLLVMLLPACASKKMAAIPDTQKPVIATSDQAVIVFMRPSGFGGAIQASVFDVTTDNNTFIGISSTNTEIAHAVSPGEKIFMVVSEAADFAYADLEAGKTYYMLVTPRFGIWKARFSLRPVHKVDLDSEDFAKWAAKCHFVRNTAESEQWAQENALDIQEKRLEYFEKWMQKEESDRPRLIAEDGVVTELNAK